MSKTSEEIEKLFRGAAEKMFNSLSPVDAEPEMVQLLEAIIANAHERAFVVELFKESLTRAHNHPWEVVQYCLHELRWEEMGEWFMEMKSKPRNIDEASFWIEMRKSLEPHWKNAIYYGRYKENRVALLLCFPAAVPAAAESQGR